jgi:hypothetical protein
MGNICLAYKNKKLEATGLPQPEKKPVEPEEREKPTLPIDKMVHDRSHNVGIPAKDMEAEVI